MKIDLHTHSVASPDGALTEAHYSKMLLEGRLDYIAITDHDTTAFAQALQAKLGPQIIVGQEVTTSEGEIIGLYIVRDIPSGLSAAQTVQAIKKQGGLVYIPHPFETVRKGLNLQTLNTIVKDVDIVETRNGRAIFQNKSKKAAEWAAKHKVPGAASSDAHGWHGWGKTYTLLPDIPTAATLPHLLQAAKYKVGSPGLRGVLYPKLNRIRRRHRA